MKSVQLPRQLVNLILTHVQGSPSAEVCGLIAIGVDKSLCCYPIANCAEDAAHRYRMDPSHQIDAMRQMREREQELFAIYHSHPTSSAAPSVIDIADAGYPEALYLIVSLNTKGVLEMRGFRIRDGHSNEVALSL
ncbi:MAG: hypothetical protein GC138_07705 [Gammaproteobacteria bacterium]|nr:hypothetical protein [Gammaproteobacteria bacterium]